MSFLQRKLGKRYQVPQILKYIHVIVCFIGLQSPVVTVARDPVLQMIFNQSRVRSNNLIWPSFS